MNKFQLEYLSETFFSRSDWQPAAIHLLTYGTCVIPGTCSPWTGDQVNDFIKVSPVTEGYSCCRLVLDTTEWVMSSYFQQTLGISLESLDEQIKAMTNERAQLRKLKKDI